MNSFCFGSAEDLSSPAIRRCSLRALRSASSNGISSAIAVLQASENLQGLQSAESGSCRNCEPKQFGANRPAFLLVHRNETLKKNSPAPIGNPMSLGSVATTGGVSSVAGVAIVGAGGQETDVEVVRSSSKSLLNLSNLSASSRASSVARVCASGSCAANSGSSKKSSGRRSFNSSSFSFLSSLPMLFSTAESSHEHKRRDRSTLARPRKCRFQ